MHRTVLSEQLPADATLDAHIEPEKDPTWIFWDIERRLSNRLQVPQRALVSQKAKAVTTAKQQVSRPPVHEEAPTGTVCRASNDAVTPLTIRDSYRNSEEQVTDVRQIERTLDPAAVDPSQATRARDRDFCQTWALSLSGLSNVSAQRDLENNLHREFSPEQAEASHLGVHSPIESSDGSNRCSITAKRDRSASSYPPWSKFAVQYRQQMRPQALQSALFHRGGRRAYLPRELSETELALMTMPICLQERTLVALSFLDDDSDAVAVPQVPDDHFVPDTDNVSVARAPQSQRPSKPAMLRRTGERDSSARLAPDLQSLNHLSWVHYSETEVLVILWPFYRQGYLEAFLLDKARLVTSSILIRAPAGWQTEASQVPSPVKAVLVDDLIEMVVAGPGARIEILSLQIERDLATLNQKAPQDGSVEALERGQALTPAASPRAIGQLTKHADLRLPTRGEVVSLSWAEHGRFLLVLLTSGSCYVLRRSMETHTPGTREPLHPPNSIWTIERRLDRVLVAENHRLETENRFQRRQNPTAQHQHHRLSSGFRTSAMDAALGPMSASSSGWPRPHHPLGIYGMPKEPPSSVAWSWTPTAYIVYHGGVAMVQLQTPRHAVAALPLFAPIPKSRLLSSMAGNQEPLLASCMVRMTQTGHPGALTSPWSVACTSSRLMLLVPGADSSLATTSSTATGRTQTRWTEASAERIGTQVPETGGISLVCLHEWPILPMRPLWRQERCLRRLAGRRSGSMFWLDALAWLFKEIIPGKHHLLVVVAVTGIRSGQTALVWALFVATAAVWGEDNHGMQLDWTATGIPDLDARHWTLERAALLPLWVPRPPKKDLRERKWVAPIPTGFRLFPLGTVESVGTLLSVRFLLVHAWGMSPVMGSDEDSSRGPLLSMTPLTGWIMALRPEYPSVEDRRQSERILRQMRAVRREAQESSSMSRDRKHPALVTCAPTTRRHWRLVKALEGPAPFPLPSTCSTKTMISLPVPSGGRDLESWLEHLARQYTEDEQPILDFAGNPDGKEDGSG